MGALFILEIKETYREMGQKELTKARKLLEEKKYEQCLEKFRIALWYFEEIYDHNQIFFIKNCISKLEKSIQQSDFNNLQLFTELEESISPRKAELNKLMNSGQQAYQMGEIEIALHNYNQALQIALQMKNYEIMSTCITIIADIYCTWGKYDDALEQYKRALQLQRELRNKQELAQILNAIGNIYDIWGEYDKAFEYYRQSLKIQHEIDDKRGMGESLNDIGDIYREWGIYNEAMKFYRAALALHKEIEYNLGIARNLNDIGNIYEELENYSEALKYYQKALQIQQCIKEPKEQLMGLSETLKDIGTIERKLNKLDAALNHHQQAIDIAKNSKEILYFAACAYELGLDYAKLGKNHQALNYFKLAFSQYRRILSEIPKEHHKSFIKQIIPLLNLIYQIEFTLDIFNEEDFLSIAKDAKDILNIFSNRKNKLQKMFKVLETSTPPRELDQFSKSLDKSFPLDQFESEPQQIPLPHKTYHQTYTANLQQQFETISKFLNIFLEILEENRRTLNELKLEHSKQRILLKLQLYVSNPKELKNYLQKILKSDWDQAKKDRYQEVIIEILEDYLDDKWYEKIGKAIVEITGKVLGESLVEIAQIGFGKLARYLKNKLIH